MISASASGPRPDLLAYQADADTGTARWVALPKELDEYTGQMAASGWIPAQFEASPFHQPGEMTSASTAPAGAPAANLARPEVNVIWQGASLAGREVTVEVSAPTQSYALTIDVRTADGIRNITVNGKTVPEASTGAPASVRVVAFSPQGRIPITVSVPADADIQLALVSYRRGLDTVQASQLHPRPANLTTAVHEVPDAVIVTRLVPLPR